MKVKSIEEYLGKMGVKADDVFTKEQAVELVNANVIAIYKGRVNLREDKIFTGYDIADKLHTIESVFTEAFEKALDDEDV
ncbi:hypothetical protein D5F11_021620 [Siminovitchia terrae]|uniref:Uncharacterized protein n=1 Tax=Siminovitchia terrae TaxID=1914933 RepID=A0A429X2I1_SIMTE|nr:hypothetical protein [Siminovitchia terrae]RST57662.1 hypothetical protein D5F11_021620 [Siminovitchia terrae]